MRYVKTSLLLFGACLVNVFAHPSTDESDTVAKLASEEVYRPMANDPRPTMTEPRPTMTEPRPTMTEPRPTMTEPRPTTNEPRPMANDPQPYVTLAKTAPLPYAYYYSGNPIFDFPQFQYNLHKMAEFSAFPFGYEGGLFSHYDQMHYNK